MGYSIKILSCHPDACRSCYERGIRKRGIPKEYNLDLIIFEIERIIGADKDWCKIKGGQKCNAPTIHGGEPLLMPFRDLEKLVKKIHSYWGYTGIQTNGLLLTDEHIELFSDYSVNVGFSIDGDTPEMNRGRWNIRKYSDSTIQKNIDIVIENMRKARVIGGLRVSLILLLRKYNARPKMIPELIKFIKRMYNEIGVWSARTNPCTVYDKRYQKEEELTERELGNALVTIGKYIFSNPKKIWHPYHDVIDMMMGYLDQTCVWKKCDPFYTTGEQPINYQGEMTNCLHPATATEGYQALRADEYSEERYDLLSKVSQKYKGCKGCRYWHICYGYCPGTGIDNDWRNRTRFCKGLKMFFSYVENMLNGMMPNLHLVPDFYPEIPTSEMVQKSFRVERGSTYARKVRFRIENLLKEREGDKVAVPGGYHGDKYRDIPHKDHWDRPK